MLYIHKQSHDHWPCLVAVHLRENSPRSLVYTRPQSRVTAKDDFKAGGWLKSLRDGDVLPFARKRADVLLLVG